MFTGRGRRQYGQEQVEEVPEPGSDSTYGVRSLGDSDWGSVSGLTTKVTQDAESIIREDEGMESVSGYQAQESTPTTNNEPLVNAEPEAEPSPASPIITSPIASLVLPEQHIEQQVEGYYRHTLVDDLSEPSSPASFASMPSYISSSLSRTSSLGPDTGRIAYSINYPGMGGSEELVMPTLNFAEGSSRKVEESGKGIKVVLMGNEGDVGDFMQELGGRKEQISSSGILVESGRGIWSLGDMAVIITSGSTEQIETRLENTYGTLNAALHPDPPLALRDEVQNLVSSYGLKSDWIHLVVVLDDRNMTSLGDIVPIIQSRSRLQDDGSSMEIPDSRLESPRAIPDPTPRPGVEGLSYFPNQDLEHPHADLISQLVNTLQSPDRLRSSSTTKFLSWRQSRRDLSSSHTSTSHSHSHEHSHESSSYEAAPMPTLARAQGGGEWEATLSRRLANRRQSVPAEESRRGRRRSTASRPKVSKGKESCGPLFPFSSSNPGDPSSGVGLGISELMEKTFGQLRRRWKWGLVAAAVALVVGWGWTDKLPCSSR